jgi:hypothetical protein
MKYRTAIITLGFVTLLVGYLGFPAALKESLRMLLVVIVILLAYLSGKEGKKEVAAESTSIQP